MLLSKDRIGGLLLLLFSVTYGLLSREITLLPFQQNTAFHARTMPEALTVLGVGLSVFIIVFSTSERPRLKGFNWGTAVAFLVLMSAYGFTVRPFGFILSTCLFLIIGFALLGERNIVRTLIVALPIVVGFWVLMTQGLDVFIEPLPAMLR